MLTFPSVRLANEDWLRLMSLAFDAENDLHPVGTFLRAEVHRAIVVDDPDDDVVRLNAWVTYRVDWEPTESRLLVHPDDYVPGGHHLSVLSPVGAALVGIRLGERMPFFDLGGTLHLVTPLSLRREPSTLGLLRRRTAE
jgi:regulator of nucleoside diphosphate kinase